MAITHKFRGFTILLIKIVSPQNKIRIYITKKRSRYNTYQTTTLNPNNLTILVDLIPLIGKFSINLIKYQMSTKTHYVILSRGFKEYLDP